MTSMLADTMRSIHCIAAAAVATTCLAWGGTPALADVTIADSGGALTGLAFDRQSSRLFAVSESDGTNILVTDSKGEKAGTVSFTASTESVQGLALHSDALYVGDIGDPNATSKKVTVYRLPTAVGNQPYQAYDFSYPDGSHDAKALLVSGKGRIYIITGGDQPGIYYAETEPSRSATNKLTRAADAPAGVTDAVFLADGVTHPLENMNAWIVHQGYLYAVGSRTSDRPGSERIINLATGEQVEIEEMPDDYVEHKQATVSASNGVMIRKSDYIQVRRNGSATAVLSRKSTEKESYRSAAIYGSVLYLALNGGRLRLVDLNTGKVIQESKTSNPNEMVTVTPYGFCNEINFYPATAWQS